MRWLQWGYRILRGELRGGIMVLATVLKMDGGACAYLRLIWRCGRRSQIVRSWGTRMWYRGRRTAMRERESSEGSQATCTLSRAYEVWDAMTMEQLRDKCLKTYRGEDEPCHEEESNSIVSLWFGCGGRVGFEDTSARDENQSIAIKVVVRLLVVMSILNHIKISKWKVRGTIARTRGVGVFPPGLEFVSKSTDSW